MEPSQPILIATRQSPLAMKQTELVREWLQARGSGATYQALPLSTKVDERLSWSLEKRGGIGLFTKELEEALLDGRACLAVHSAKDLPTRFEHDLQIAGYLPRARANDVLVRRADIEQPRCIASSSPRRRAQLQKRLPEAEWTTIRGNVGTRLRKIAEGRDGVDASLLAGAGLDRLEIKEHEGLVFEELPIADCVPAPGQAAIAVQCRGADLSSYSELFCPATDLAVSLERAFLRRLGGGCQTPVGAHYDGRDFHTFHPDSGYRCTRLDLKNRDAIDSALDDILEQLKSGTD